MPDEADGTVVTCNKPITGRYVVIFNNRTEQRQQGFSKNAVLELCEVEVPIEGYDTLIVSPAKYSGT